MTQPYCGPGALPADVLMRWNGDPILLASLAMISFWLLWYRRSMASVMAIAALFLAFVSPLCALTVSLFSARAVHHLIVAGVAAPALALALPVARRVAPVFAAVLLGAGFVGWHVPALYQAAWQSDQVYWAMQAAILLPAWAFWSGVLKPDAPASDLFGHAFLVAALAGVMGLIGAVLTFAPEPLYPEHLPGAYAWQISALDDQRLAGLIMWVPGLLPMAWLAFRMLRNGWQRGFA